MNTKTSLKQQAKVKEEGRLLKTAAALRRDYILYIMLIPFVLWYILFIYKPMGGLVIAFKNYNLFQGITKSPWVGLDNFKAFLTGPYCLRLIRNTVLIGIYGMIFNFPASILLALMLNEVRNRTYKKTLQTLMYAPYFISAVVACGMIVNMLSPTTGVVNALIAKFGGERVYFLSKPEYFRTIYVLMRIWKNCGYDAIIYVAALSAIDSQLYEACMIDGGGKLRQLWHITIPGIMPTVMVMLILSVGSMFNVSYESIILLYQPSTYETADVISTYVYRAGLTEGNYGVATAVGLFDSVVGLVLVLASNTFSKRVSEYSAF